MSDHTLFIRRVSENGRATYEPVGTWPATSLGEGLWMVERAPNYTRTLSLRRYADLPDPMPAAALELHRDVIATAIGDLMRKWSRGDAMSPASWADEIIAAVARKEAAG
jgi:hypothetical protein